MKSLMIDHIEGKLKGELEEYVNKLIDNNDAARREYYQLKEVMELFDQAQELEPPASKNEFMSFIEEIKRQRITEKPANKIKLLPFNWIYGVAGAVLLIVFGIIIGRSIKGNSNSELAALRAEIERAKASIIMNMKEESSASQRIRGVLAASIPGIEPDDAIIDALIERINEDSNVNVRIVAVEALGIYSNDAKVRNALINAIENQDQPLVQIRLIHLMVEIDEKSAITPLENLAKKESIMNTVQDEIHMGLFKLKKNI